jgi:hypothetical protein
MRAPLRDFSRFVNNHMPISDLIAVVVGDHFRVTKRN